MKRVDVGKLVVLIDEQQCIGCKACLDIDDNSDADEIVDIVTSCPGSAIAITSKDAKLVIGESR